MSNENKGGKRAVGFGFRDEVTKGHGVCWQSTDGGLTGTYCAEEDAKISIWDMGFFRAVALYDFTPMWKGWLLKLDRHIERFYQNLHACRMDPEISQEQFKKQLLETVRRSELENAGVIQICTWGPYPIVYERGEKKPGGPDHKVGLHIWVRPFTWAFAPKYVTEGVKTIITSIRNYPHQCTEPRLKHTNRMHFFLADLEVVNAGLDGSITLTLDGHLSESFASNVWLVKNGKLFTPSESCLNGITAECVFELAREMNIEATATLLAPWDLYTADEAFFSSSAGGIFPIVEVDARNIGNGKPGETTKRLIDAYWKMHVDPRHALQVYETTT